jgi:mannose-6-phosphate isomerase class I
MDWASVTSTAITGAVGIAGVAGTILAAKIASKSATKDLQLSIHADNERANKTEKRRIYAACQAVFDEMTIAAVVVRHRDFKDNKEARDKAQMKSDQARDAMYQKVSEVRLIAPPDVHNTAREIADKLIVYNAGIDDDEIPGLRLKLFQAMRADLWETS